MIVVSSKVDNENCESCISLRGVIQRQEEEINRLKTFEAMYSRLYVEYSNLLELQTRQKVAIDELITQINLNTERLKLLGGDK